MRARQAARARPRSRPRRRRAASRSPRPGSTPRKPPPMTPPSAARPAPSAKTPARRVGTLMPTPRGHLRRRPRPRGSCAPDARARSSSEPQRASRPTHATATMNSAVDRERRCREPRRSRCSVAGDRGSVGIAAPDQQREVLEDQSAKPIVISTWPSVWPLEAPQEEALHAHADERDGHWRRRTAPAGSSAVRQHHRQPHVAARA